jgi:hypothetical protein
MEGVLSMYFSQGLHMTKQIPGLHMRACSGAAYESLPSVEIGGDFS